jgi:hypothetical protein
MWVREAWEWSEAGNAKVSVTKFLGAPLSRRQRRRWFIGENASRCIKAVFDGIL